MNKIKEVVTPGVLSIFVMSFLFAMCFSTLLFYGDIKSMGGFILIALLGPCAVAAVVSVCGAKRMADLAKRARTSEEAVNAFEVRRDGIKIGAVEDSEYAAIHLSVFNDPLSYTAQFINICNGVLSIVFAVMRSIPGVFFWCMIYVAMIDSMSFGAMLSALLKPDVIPHFLKSTSALAIIVVYAVIFIVLNVAMGINFGFKDCFTARVHEAIRKQCTAALDGNISLVIQSPKLKSVRNHE